jgi:hypothetical protein
MVFDVESRLHFPNLGFQGLVLKEESFGLHELSISIGQQ